MYKYLFWLGILFSLSILTFFYMGFYNFSANTPHWPITTKLITISRDNAISRVANDIKTPNLNNPAFISSGAQDYNDMCAGCHMSPLQLTPSDLHQNLYPSPPNLTKPSHFRPNEQFWIIKHGLKMTGMPAWGTGHSDERIWAMVAFIQQLPKLNAEQYQILASRHVINTSEHQESAHE
jgi:cytochrome c5